MPYKSDTADAAIAHVAARQHGVVTAKQLQPRGWDEWRYPNGRETADSTAFTKASTPWVTEA